MKKSQWIIRLFALSAALWMGGAAAGAQSGKIGFVDIDQVTQKAAFVKQMLGNLESTMGDRQKALEAKQEEYSRLKDEIDRKRTAASDEEMDSLRKRAKDLLSQIDDENYQLNKMLDKARKEQMGPALDRILETVRTVGREEGFDLIVRGEMVLYGAPAVDITDKVVNRLNQQAGSGATGAAPSAGAAAALKSAGSDEEGGSQAAATPKKARRGLRLRK